MATSDDAGSGARLRIGDTERMAAIGELSQHFAEGRLDAQEMDDRSGAVTAAQTRGDLREIFADLPADENGNRDPDLAVALGDAPTRSKALARRKKSDVETAAERKRQDRNLMVKRTIMALTPPLAFLLFFLLLSAEFYAAWLVFFAIPAVGALLFGGEFYEDDEAVREARKRQIRERGTSVDKRDEDDAAEKAVEEFYDRFDESGRCTGGGRADGDEGDDAPGTRDDER